MDPTASFGGEADCDGKTGDEDAAVEDEAEDIVGADEAAATVPRSQGFGGETIQLSASRRDDANDG